MNNRDFLSCCATCLQKKELRPYGLNYAMICFACAMKPDQIQRTADNFAQQLESADDGFGNILLTQIGPMPITRPRQ